MTSPLGPPWTIGKLMGWIAALAVLCAVVQPVPAMFLIGVGAGFVALIAGLARFGGMTRLRAACWVFAGYPWLGLALIYLAWLAAWATLGHRPIPLKNDPSYINDLVSILGGLAWLLILGWPIGLLGACFLPCSEAINLNGRLEPGPGRTTELALLVFSPTLLWIGAIVLFWLDPVQAMNWFAD